MRDRPLYCKSPYRQDHIRPSERMQSMRPTLWQALKRQEAMVWWMLLLMLLLGALTIAE